MAQVIDFNIAANPSGLNMRTELNGIIEAILTQNSGTDEPLNPFSGMEWVDKSDVNFYYIKKRNLTNDDWEVIYVYDVLNNKINPFGEIAYTIETVNDFVNIPTIYKTAIVKDLNRGGTFIWSATGTANGGTVFAGDTGYWNRQYDGAVNIEWFGAKGDGVVIAFANGSTGTDNTQAILKALEVSNSIYIPKGTFAFYTPIVITRSDIYIYGEGINTSTLMYLGDTNTTGLTFGDESADFFRYIQLENFTIKVGSFADNVSALKWKRVIKSKISNCIILGNRNPNIGQTLTGTGFELIDNCFMNSIERLDAKLFNVGVDLVQTTTYVGDIVFYGQGELQDNMVGIRIGTVGAPAVGGGNVTIRDYTIEGNRDIGIKIDSILTGILIDGIWFESNTNNHIVIGSALAGATTPHSVKITNSLLADSGTGIKIKVNNVIGLILENNRISKEGSTKILDLSNTPSDVKRLVFKDNTCTMSDIYSDIIKAETYTIYDLVTKNSGCEIITNANGTAYKYDNGELVIKKQVTDTTGTGWVTIGGTAGYAIQKVDTALPVSFISWVDVVQNINLFYSSSYCWIGSGTSDNKNGIRYAIYAPVNTADIVYKAEIILKGRWK